MKRSKTLKAIVVAAMLPLLYLADVAEAAVRTVQVLQGVWQAPVGQRRDACGPGLQGLQFLIRRVQRPQLRALPLTHAVHRQLISVRGMRCRPGIGTAGCGAAH